MRARHVVTLGIGIGAAGALAAFAGCGESTFGTCQDDNQCAGDGSADGTSTADGVSGDQHVGTEGGGHDGGATEGGTISCDAATAITCNGVCVDKETDPGNCGSCGHSCSGPEAGTGNGLCVSGACQIACASEAGTTLLCPSGACVDPTTTATCGSCTNTCYGPEAGPGHAVCQPGGMCAVACDSDAGDAAVPDILCSGSCVSPDDVNHCGTCTACAQPPSGNGSPTCPAAQCVMTCVPGYHPSGASCNADCTLTAGDDPSTDPCVVADGLGIFVSPTGSDSSPADGSKEHPFGTIGHAMDTAEGGGKRVYACGTFTGEQLVVGASRDGVSVYGGFDCTTWAYSASTKTKLAPTAAGFALQVNGLTTGVTFEDFEFDSIAAPLSVASGAGASSMAVIVNGSAGVVFRRVAMKAGAAQTGGTGTNGTNSWTAGTSATSGTPASGTTGGSGISCTCGGTGGQGGAPGTLDPSVPAFTAGSNGNNGTPLGITDQGLASTSATTKCSPGDSQGGVSAGTPGSGGLGGAGVGSLSFPSGWANAAVAGTGGDGTVGQGGGGGGGFYYVVGSTPDGAGGGGGCGGCGGAPGTGGFAGGSSIALVVLTSAVTLDTCSLTAASGGTGGLGGNGVGGQLGGGGGGGSGANSCSGGAGGQGGEGGAGGGGVGGNSLAIAYSGTAPTEVGTVDTAFATTAALGGGPGGGNSSATSQGNPGLFQAEQSF